MKRGYKVTSIEVCKEVAGTTPRETVSVKNIDDYLAGCKLHPKCIGHMCTTPTGVLLPFQSLSLTSGDIVTQYTTAVRLSFDSPGDYKKALESTNRGKFGNLRAVLRTPVAGSARLVVTPHAECEIGTVYVSDHLASKILFCSVRHEDGGSQCARFEERSLAEGDYVILERPPSLSLFNNQPMKVKFWDRETLGVHPEVFTFLGGDFDGDEAHIFPISSPEALEEARSWEYPEFTNFTKARSTAEQYNICNVMDRNEPGNMEFLNYCTLSANQIEKGGVTLHLGNHTRNKDQFVSMLGERLRNKESCNNFIADSVQGVKDIMRQQLSQGSIGYMSRVAKIAMMCFIRGSNGGTYVSASKSRVLLFSGTEAKRGIPSVRVTLALCREAQQSALNAHKVGELASVSFDFVSSVLLGRGKQPNSSTALSTQELAATPVETFLVFSTSITDAEIKSLSPMWFLRRDVDVVMVAKDSVPKGLLRHCIGAYSPVILRTLSTEFTSRVGVCLSALTTVFAYLGVPVETDDLVDMAAGFSYQCDRSSFPITHSEGLRSRDLAWCERSVGTDMRMLSSIAGSVEEPRSSTSASVMSNFSMIA